MITKRLVEITLIIMAVIALSVIVLAGCAPPSDTNAGTVSTGSNDAFTRIGSPPGYKVDVFTFTATRGLTAYTCILAIGPTTLELECP